MSKTRDSAEEGVYPDSSVLEYLDQAVSILNEVQTRLDNLNISIASAHINDALEVLKRQAILLRGSGNQAELD